MIEPSPPPTVDKIKPKGNELAGVGESALSVQAWLDRQQYMKKKMEDDADLVIKASLFKNEETKRQ